MVIKVGINGFGRIGRVIFRTCCQVPDLEVSAINDPAIDLDYIAYLIKFDSTHGKCKESVSYEHNVLKINGNPVKVFHQKSPPDIPWQDAGVQYVIEASGMFTSLEKASGHLASEGVHRVLVTAPSSDVPMLILGVNEDRFNTEMKVISCASSTLYCLAPLVKLLQERYGVAEGLVTSIHAMTPSLKPLDGLCVRGKHWRDHRSIHQNIIPAATGACKALGRIIPAVRDKLTGLAFRVPIANVSVLDLSIRLNKDTSVKEITESIERLSDSALHNIMQVSREQAVSSDFIGDNHSCTLDFDSSLQLKPNFFKLICWYENEYSYACRVIDTILYCDREESAAVIARPTKITFVRPRSCKAYSEHQQTDAGKKHVGIECISFPLLLASPYESRVAKPLMRPVLKRPTLFISETKQSREPPREPDKSRTTTEGCVKTCSVQNKIVFHENTIASLQTNSKERRKLQGLTVKTPEEFTTQSSSKKQEPTNTNKSSSSEMTGKVHLSSCASFQAESKKNSIQMFDTGNKEQTNSRTSEFGGDIKSVQSFDKSKSNSRCEIYPNIIKNDLNVKLKNLHELRIKNEPNLLQRFPRASIKTPTPSNSKEIRNKICNAAKATLWNEIKLQSSTNDYKSRVINRCDNFVEVLNCATECRKNRDGTNTGAGGSGEVIHIISDNTENEVASTKNIRQDIHGVHEPLQLISSQKLIGKDTWKNIGTEEVKVEMNVAEALLKQAAPKIEIVDEKLKQRNIVLVDYVVDNTQASNVSRNNKTVAAGDYHDQVYEQMCNETNESRKRANDPIVIVSEDSSQCASPVNTITTISNLETYRSKQDIYDKLDSASVSDSNNSFQMHEKKSQIINITDLNYSLDDLNRLDKICRIIEISDELSDKLFAPLDSVPAVSGRKQWSFRDLCERIKLDEFCNNVFGKSAS